MNASSRNLGMALLLLSSIGWQTVRADANFDAGKQCYDKRQYAQAVIYFHKSAQDSPWDSTAAYYEALCYHQLREYGKAKEAYRSIMEHFPGSAAYVNAASALKVLDPDYMTSKSGSAATVAAAMPTAADGSLSAAQLQALYDKVTINGPNKCSIPADRQLGKTYVTVTVNGLTKKFEFGGETTMICGKDAAAAGIKATKGRVPSTVRVGQIAEYDFPLAIDESAGSPRLGQDFFKKLNYTVGASSIDVVKAASNSYDVPFSMSGNEMTMRVNINGRTANVVFDAQASENVLPRNQARMLGLDVDERSETNMVTADNPDGAVRGDPNFGKVEQKSSTTAKVIATGPVVATVTFKVDDKAQQVKMSPAAFSGWQYTVDQGTKKIHFYR